jgi:hypothetical protein
MVLKLLPATSLGSAYKFVVKDITSHQPPVSADAFAIPDRNDRTELTSPSVYLNKLLQTNATTSLTTCGNIGSHYKRLRVRGNPSLIGQLAEVVPRQSTASGQACRACRASMGEARARWRVLRGYKYRHGSVELGESLTKLGLLDLSTFVSRCFSDLLPMLLPW